LLSPMVFMALNALPILAGKVVFTMTIFTCDKDCETDALSDVFINNPD